MIDAGNSQVDHFEPNSASGTSSGTGTGTGNGSGTSNVNGNGNGNGNGNAGGSGNEKKKSMKKKNSGHSQSQLHAAATRTLSAQTAVSLSQNSELAVLSQNESQKDKDKDEPTTKSAASPANSETVQPRLRRFCSLPKRSQKKQVWSESEFNECGAPVATTTACQGNTVTHVPRLVVTGPGLMSPQRSITTAEAYRGRLTNSEEHQRVTLSLAVPLSAVERGGASPHGTVDGGDGAKIPGNSIDQKPNDSAEESGRGESRQSAQFHPSQLGDSASKHTSSNYLKEQIISFFQPSDNKLAMKLFGNRNALMKEKIRQQESGFRFIIHPCSSFRFYWDLVMLICLNVNVIVLPVIIAYFNDNLGSHWLIFNSISDALFIVDIVTNFRTGVITNDYAEQIVLNPRQIALHYIKTWFVLDVISTIPMDYLFLLFQDDENDQVRTAHLMHAGRALRILRLAKLLSLLRLLRFSRVVRYVTQWEEFLNIAKMVIRVFNLVLLILLLAHWQACLQFLIPSLNDFPADCWVTIEELVDAPWISQYTWSVFRAMSHMLSIGYGRIPPQSTSDAWMTMGSMLTGAICYAMFVGHASALIQSFDTSRRLYREKWKQVEEYMAFRKFPRSLRERISSYYEHRYQGKMFNEDAILCELSECLKQQIVNYNCRALVAAVPFFTNADPDFVTQVVTKLKFEVYQPGDVVIKEGTLGTKMYFIQEGIVDIITKDGEVATSLSDGSYFGEICLLTNARRVASVRTVTYCNLYSLSKDHFNEVLDEYPLMRRTMEMIAAERLHKIGEPIQIQQLAISRAQNEFEADCVVKEIVTRVLEEDQYSALARSIEDDDDSPTYSSDSSSSIHSHTEGSGGLRRSGSQKQIHRKKRNNLLNLNIPLLSRSRRESQISLNKIKREKSNSVFAK